MYNTLQTSYSMNPFYVDLHRYTGLWYDIAHIPAYFQPPGGYNTTATYSLNMDGTLGVYNNTYYNMNGYQTQYSIYGIGRSIDTNNRRLTIDFPPSNGVNGPLPGAKGYYDIVILVEDCGNYRYSVVSDPDRRTLYILSRTPYPPSCDIQDLLSKGAAAGYNVNALEYTYHKY